MGVDTVLPFLKVLVREGSSFLLVLYMDASYLATTRLYFTVWAYSLLFGSEGRVAVLCSEYIS